MNKLLPGSVPTIKYYNKILSSKMFLEMETFSDSFLAKNEKYLEGYSRKWVNDPLHQWSRQWEYPFIFSRLNSLLQDNQEKKILDAGSGATFFPFFLKSKFSHCSIYCCDIDENLSKTFSLLNKSMECDISFSFQDLENLDYENSFFDCIYCISVIEHILNFNKVVEEFFRVIKPGGYLILSFDVSLDGKHKISLYQAKELLLSLEEKFLHNEKSLINIDEIPSREDIIKTNYFNKMNHLLPWPPPTIFQQFKSIIRGKGIITYPAPFTVFSVILGKPEVDR